VRRSWDTRGFVAVLYKEFFHVVRDPMTLVLAIMVPTLQLLIFGWAINTKVEHIATAYYDEDHGSVAVRVLDALRASNQFDLDYRALSRDDLRRQIVGGRVRVAIDIPPNFTADVRLRRPTDLQVLIDGSDSVVAQQAFAAASSIGQALSRQLDPSLSALPNIVDVRPRMLFNPSLRSANFLVPGLIGVILQLVTVFLTSMSIVGEREKGTLEQILVTPIGPAGLMFGKLVPYTVIASVDFVAVLAAMRFIFQVPIAGNLWLLMLLALGFLFCALALGLLISSAAQTQMQAMLMTFATIGPSILLSGFFFERDAMPLVMQWVGYAIPLTYFLQILRGIVLRGAGMDTLWPATAAMLGLMAILVGLAAARFARTAS